MPLSEMQKTAAEYKELGVSDTGCKVYTLSPGRTMQSQFMATGIFRVPAGSCPVPSLHQYPQPPIQARFHNLFQSHQFHILPAAFDAGDVGS